MKNFWNITSKLGSATLRKRLEDLTEKHLSGQITTEEWLAERIIIGEAIEKRKQYSEHIHYLLTTNQFEEIFSIFKQMNIEDCALQISRYHAIKQHELAGGSFESVENQLASIRVWINGIIHKLSNEETD